MNESKYPDPVSSPGVVEAMTELFSTIEVCDPPAGEANYVHQPGDVAKALAVPSVTTVYPEEGTLTISPAGVSVAPAGVAVYNAELIDKVVAWWAGWLVNREWMIKNNPGFYIYTGKVSEVSRESVTKFINALKDAIEVYREGSCLRELTLWIRDGVVCPELDFAFADAGLRNRYVWLPATANMEVTFEDKLSYTGSQPQDDTYARMVSTETLIKLAQP